MSHIPSGFSLDEASKWLKRPVSAAWGSGGGLVCVGNLLSTTGQGQSQTVHVRKVVSEGGVVKRTKQLVEVDQAKALQSFAESKTNEGGEDKEAWKTLASLFTTAVDTREQLISALGFDKIDVRSRVEEPLELRLSESFGVDLATGKSLGGDEAVEEVIEGKRVISFVEPAATINLGVEERLGEGE
jgi:protein transport protein SEC31